MIKVKIKTKGRYKITIPIPYFVLKSSSSILCSNFIFKKIVSAEEYTTTNNPTNTPFPVNKEIIKPLLKTTINELQNHRGLTIVDTKLHDGTSISIHL
ncbi:hypothetical protein ACFSTA_03885 [Ornithinibacillus salinisoli]|uniref:Uncharacterized protein n=2 Tax=Ornithinibacillus salinisoli TaxID=1848459 RepID=A0ABW4VY98_9BACI